MRTPTDGVGGHHRDATARAYGAPWAPARGRVGLLLISCRRGGRARRAPGVAVLALANVELRTDVVHVRLDRALAEEQPLGDAGVGPPPPSARARARTAPRAHASRRSGRS